MKSREARRYIRSHGGLRGVASCLVVGYHLQYGGQPKLAIETASEFFNRSYLLVDLFFILSGFVISYTSLKDINSKHCTKNIIQFLFQRFARIFPLHAFCLVYLVIFLGTVAILQNVTGGNPDLERWSGAGLLSLLIEFFLMHAWGLGYSVSWTVPSWSISAEMFAYFLFPLLAIIISWRFGSALILACSATFFLWIGVTIGDLDTISGIAPFRCLAGFVIGMMLYRQRNIFLMMSDAALNVCQASAVIAIVAMLMVPVNDSLIILPFALLVGSTWTDRGAAASALSTRPFTFLGNISYSIYLNHVCVMQILNIVWWRIIPHFDWISNDSQRIIWIFCVSISTFVLSIFTYNYIEGPARRYLIERAKLSRN